MRKKNLKQKLYPKINNISGILISTGTCGLKENSEKDLAVIQIEKNSETTGIFTNSKTLSEAVRWSKKNIKNKIRAIIVNSGNANALTGKSGYNSIKKYSDFLGKTINCNSKNILVASTGVIGKQLNYKKVNKEIPKLYKKSQIKCCSWMSFAKSIMTTDIYPKLSTKKVKIANKNILISGVAKGSGMIYPNMGTMLAFIFTDAIVPKIIKITVKNAKNYKSAKNVGFSISNSLLVKTTHGSKEPNFGRIFMAIGKSYELINQDKISFSIGKFLIVRNGKLLDKIKTTEIKNYIKGKILFLSIDLNNGKESATVYSCDLTHKYIDINTQYLT